MTEAGRQRAGAMQQGGGFHRQQQQRQHGDDKLSGVLDVERVLCLLRSTSERYRLGRAGLFRCEGEHRLHSELIQQIQIQIFVGVAQVGEVLQPVRGGNLSRSASGFLGTDDWLVDQDETSRYDQFAGIKHRPHEDGVGLLDLQKGWIRHVKHSLRVVQDAVLLAVQGLHSLSQLEHVLCGGPAFAALSTGIGEERVRENLHNV
mmetsp:Transcript_54962/g.96184  ORF Transcript_54962/g.96184 Transcript_54962/m.96184 type:complete len:204 (+) Transcript_54962:612-1223(+)